MAKAKSGFDQWKKMGAEIQDIENRLKAFLLNPRNQELMTARLTDTLLKAVEYVEKFKTRAEDRMFLELDPARSNDYFDVFYSDKQLGDIVEILVDNHDPV